MTSKAPSCMYDYYKQQYRFKNKLPPNTSNTLEAKVYPRTEFLHRSTTDLCRVSFCCGEGGLSCASAGGLAASLA